jgi:phosphoglucosamine mutase
MGRAVVRTLREEGIDRPVIAVGRDPRLRGDARGRADRGRLLGGRGRHPPRRPADPRGGVPHLPARGDSGAMISASHNPVEDNGIKFFGPTATSSPTPRRSASRSCSSAPTRTGRPARRSGGSATRRRARVLRRPPRRGRRRRPGGAAVVVDCANGAATTVAPEVLRRLGCDVMTICAEPDGNNINAGCGSTHPEVVAGAVREHGADVGWPTTATPTGSSPSTTPAGSSTVTRSSPSSPSGGTASAACPAS